MATATTPLAHEHDGLPEFTLRAILAGITFGVIFGAANAYLGLRVGLTVSTSIPIAVLTVALFRALSAKGGVILEANLSQTIGSASSSLAAGTIFTIPALFLWGLVPPLHQVAILAWLGGILGICAMVPLRRLLIVRSAGELPYPEGTACAEVLKATTESAPGGRFIFEGLAIGAAVKLAIGGFSLVSSELGVHVGFLPKAELTLEIAPALLAVGYILGYTQSAVMVAGSLISAMVLIPLIALVGDQLTAPLFPEATKTIHEMSTGQIWSRYVRYIGAGAVAAAGIVTVIRSLPTMYRSLAAVLGGLRGDAEAAGDGSRTDRDVPGWVVVAGPAVVIATLALVPGLFAGDMNFFQRLVAATGVAIFGVAFVVVSSRIVGLIGVSSNPTSGMTLVTLLGTALIFVALGWQDDSARAAILTVGTVVCIAASKAGDISQDLKTGQLVGATPARQQVGQLIGAAFACWAVAATVLLLGKAFGFGSAELPAPQATLMKTVIEGVLSGALPWGLVGVGGAFSLCGLLGGLPGLPFAVGLYLPLASLTPIYVGGCVRRLVDARRGGPAKDGDPGVLMASGLIAGEGLAGVAIAFLVAAKSQFAGLEAWLASVRFAERDFAHLAGTAGTAAGLVVVAAVCALLYRAGRSGAAAQRQP
ncbi:MAG: oligopeptide transporter, OPT family [Vicinamibacteria bacterium]|jgi:putative OPT family oligopeptide transporter|nr:oligopeptide transporter, OPT family [Vicinamibacteria bacterium]